MSSADDLIDLQRKEFENPTEWKRRRAFLMLNFNGLPFDRLVCLSHCYVNSNMHGAVYPARVMDEVEQYSRSIDGYLHNGAAASHGDGGSSDSAHGHKRKTGSGGDDEPPWKRKPPPPASADGQQRRPLPLDLDSQLRAVAASASAAASASDGAEKTDEAVAEVSLPQDLDLTEFYLREIETDDSTGGAANPANVLKCSTDFCRRTLEYQFEEKDSGGGVRCWLVMDGRMVAAASGASKAAAKATVSAGVLTALRRRCWTLVVRSDRAFIRAQADAGVARPEAGDASAVRVAADNDSGGADSDKIGSDNVGHRLLMGMGWKGEGGLGKRLDGRADPVIGDVRVVSRAGLGADDAAGGSGAAGGVSAATFQSAVGRVLRDFQRDQEDRDDLFFAADFTNEERRHVHSQCLKLGLASRSYGATDGVRCLVVSRKRSAAQLVDFVRRNGGSTVRYRLVPPDGVGDEDGGV